MWGAIVGALLCLWIPAAALAQTPPATRAEALDAERAAREQSPGVESHNVIERSLFYIEDKRILERLNPPEGFYPTAGSIVRGSGFGVGLGYRRRPLGGRLLFDASAAATYRTYKTAHVVAGATRIGGAPLDVVVGARWYDYTQEDFFGLGPETPREQRVSFTLGGVDTYAQVMARRAGWLVLRGRVGVHQFELGRGQDARFPSIEETFTDATAPGLTSTPTLTYAEAGVGVDTRDQPRNTRSGGLYNVSFGVFRNRTHTDYDFNRVDLTALHVFPIFDRKRGILLHAAASRIDPIGNARVPFFLMPTLGGADSLRGFREFRFRDATALTLNAEYRWEAFSGLDLALFADAGDVGPSWRSLVGAHLRSSWGMGFRFNTNRRVFLRVDIARSREGLRVWTAMGPVFRR